MERIFLQVKSLVKRLFLAFPNILIFFITISPLLVCLSISFAGVSDEFIYPVRGEFSNSEWHVEPGRDFEFVNDEYVQNKYHLGEDWNFGTVDDDLNKPVYAIGAGFVRFSGDGGSGWNGVVIIEHDLGNISQHIYSLYGHLDKKSILKWSCDDDILQGEEIGKIGPTPQGSTAPHLHFEIRTNDNSDPFNPGGGYSTSFMGWTDPSDFIDFYSSFSTQIASLQSYFVSYRVPDYLPSTSYWGSFLSYFCQQYDELYFSARNAQSLAINSLIYASKSLRIADTESAKKYLNQAKRYKKLMLDIDQTAIQIWNGQIDITSDVVRSIYDGSKASVIFGTGHVASPKAASVVEMLFLPLDFANDMSMYGKEIATGNLEDFAVSSVEEFRDKILKDVFVEVIFDEISIPLLGDKTIHEWISKGVNHEVGNSKIYSILNEIVADPALKEKIMRKITFTASGMANDVVDDFAGNFIQGLIDSVFKENLSSSPSTFPARSASEVSPSISEISIKSAKEVTLTEAASLKVTDFQGSILSSPSVAISGKSLTISLSQPLSAGTTYKVLNVPGWDNDQYPWTFTTESAGLKVGTDVIVANTGKSGLNLRSGPGIYNNILARIEEGERFIIIDGPVVADGYIWWKVDNSLLVGWSAVGDWLSPSNAGGLQIGASVNVANTSGLGLRMRRAPGLTEEIITTLPEGELMTIIGGPFLVDGYLWWNVSGTAGEGWSAVAYWLVASDFMNPNLTFSNPSSGTNLELNQPVNLTFSASDNSGSVDRVEILFSSNGGASFAILDTLAGTANNYIWTPNETTSDGVIKVSAYDSTGRFTALTHNITIGEFETIPTNSSTKLDTPVVADPGISNNSGAYLLFWGKVNGATSYIVQETVNGQSSEFLVQNATQVTLSNRTNGDYYYKVKALADAYISSDWGGPVDMVVDIEVVTNQPPDAPYYPLPFDTQQNIPVIHTYLQWHCNDPGGGFVEPRYQILFGTSPNNLAVIRDYGVVNDRDDSLTHAEQLLYSTTYYWQVTAIPSLSIGRSLPEQHEAIFS